MKVVKFLIAVFVLSFAMNIAQAQSNAIDKFFGQYVEDDRFTVVYISPKLFKIIGELDVEELDFDDEEAKAILEIAGDMSELRILVAEQDASSLYKEAKSKINTKDYEVLMTVKDKGEQNVEFLIKDDGGDIIKELLLMVGGGDEFVLLSFVGEMDLNKILKMANSFDKKGKHDQDGEER